MPTKLSLAPGARFQLSRASGNEGRTGFVLAPSNTEPGKVLVRFDGFAYNSITNEDWLVNLPDEPFRPLAED